MSIQTIFLSRAYRAAQAAHHIFPAFAACEAALESGWGRSQLAVEANNLFGQKQSHPPLPGTETIAMPTREFLHGHWLTVSANWAKFADWSECFQARMEVLERLSRAYPHYAAALKAANGEQYVTAVSQSWSTDPERAGKVWRCMTRTRTSSRTRSERRREGAVASDRRNPGLKVETWGTHISPPRTVTAGPSTSFGRTAHPAPSAFSTHHRSRCIQHSVFLFQRK